MTTIRIQKYFGAGLAALAVFFVVVALMILLAAVIEGAFFPPKDWLDPLIKCLGAAALCLLLMRAGPLKKWKGFGAEIEFQEAVIKGANETKNTVLQLEAMLAEVRATVPSKKPSAEMAEEPVPLAMPALPRSRFTDDPQKGRFGGLSEKDGYALKASFAGDMNGNIVTVVLTVSETSGVLENNVHFFLHPTFSSSEMIATPLKGVATVELLIYGGFTVGAWIEGTKTLLELDLSQLKDAPHVVKTL